MFHGKSSTWALGHLGSVLSRFFLSKNRAGFTETKILCVQNVEEPFVSLVDDKNNNNFLCYAKINHTR